MAANVENHGLLQEQSSVIQNGARAQPCDCELLAFEVGEHFEVARTHNEHEWAVALLEDDLALVVLDLN